MLEDIKETETKIYATVKHSIIFSKQTGRTQCTCPAGSMGKRCRHRREIEEYVMNKDKPRTYGVNPLELLVRVLAEQTTPIAQTIVDEGGINVDAEGYIQEDLLQGHQHREVVIHHGRPIEWDQNRGRWRLHERTREENTESVQETADP